MAIAYVAAANISLIPNRRPNYTICAPSSSPAALKGEWPGITAPGRRRKERRQAHALFAAYCAPKCHTIGARIERRCKKARCCVGITLHSYFITI
nr:MAG TPA: hypothetical protein [Caudoviricetes sp.]